jgi:ABC-type branched-subunit amino acid transport system substrate-binding protein
MCALRSGRPEGARRVAAHLAAIDAAPIVWLKGSGHGSLEGEVHGMRSRAVARALAVIVSVTLVGAACGSDDTIESGTATTAPADIDYEALGLWDDGPCDEGRDKLVIGLQTVFESPVLSLEDQAVALEAAADAFNARGGANSACIEVHTCDDGTKIDKAVACAREMDRAGVVATVNDQGTAGQAEVSAALAEAGIPRVASNVTNVDWGDRNAYPLDASGTGVAFLLPQALIERGVTDLGMIRVDLAAATALIGLIRDLYEEQGATIPFEAPVPDGTTDFSQFILGAQNAGVGGVFLAIGENEAIQVVRAGQQLGTDLLIGASLGSFSHASVSELGDFADQMVFLWSYPPATADVPVYEALRSDLAASGEEALQPENLKASPMRSWIGLYALLRMIRDAGMNEFTREGISAMLQQAKDVPMLGIFGDENWTPNLNHEGLFQRAGTNSWQVWSWDGDASGPGVEGNFVPVAELQWDEVVCGSIFGDADGPC